MLIPPAFSVKFDFQPAKSRMDSTKIRNTNKINSATKVPTGKGRTEMFINVKSVFLNGNSHQIELTNEFV